jgi:hypothetical protein
MWLFGSFLDVDIVWSACLYFVRVRFVVGLVRTCTPRLERVRDLFHERVGYSSHHAQALGQGFNHRNLFRASKF